MPKVRVIVGRMLFAAALVIAAAAPGRAEKRVALLIGNNAYQNVPALKTAVNDARSLAGVLRKLNFTVVVAENQSRHSMSEALLAFDKVIEPGDIAFFFFAGHGFEIRGQNYLLPTDVPAASEGEDELVRDASFPADRIIERLQARGARTAILVLDACRNNPFERRGARGIAGAGGLAPMTPVEGVFVLFSAGAKQVALDGLSRNDPNPNSVFTRNLAPLLSEPGLTLVQIAKRIQTQVKQAAATVGHEQTPAYYDQVVGEIVLAAGGKPAAAQVVALPSATAKSAPPEPAIANQGGVLAELDALAAAENWSELAGRLTEVKPTERDAHWNALVEQAALGKLTPLARPSGASVGERLAAIEQYYPKFPSLRGSQRFMALRAAVGLDAFGRCFNDGRAIPEWRQQCREGLEGFVRTPPMTADMVRAAGVLVGRKLNWTAAAEVFAMAFEIPGGDAVCTEPELPEAIIRGLGLPPERPEVKAGLVLAERCWNTVKDAVVANVAKETGTSYYVRNTCPIVMKNNAVTGLRAARCRELGVR
jgi:Caspase domain